MPERCALYCRLSKEDDQHRDESESIANQKAILTAYARGQDWSVTGIYVDEDMSGADGTRPGFLALLTDAAAGRFDIVLCKSQSRFTRDMEAVEKYIHGSFRAWGIRFVSVTDGADTALPANKKARQINGLVNEWYLEDLSANVRAVLDCKRAAGQYIGAFALYGYKKDPTTPGHLIPDPPAADVVRRIFAMYQTGTHTRAIADALNDAGVASPGAYKTALYPGYPRCENHWNKNAVVRILKNEMYTGEMIQGRQKKASYKSAARLSVPQSHWLRVSSTHEGLISKAQFDSVQNLMSSCARIRRTAPEYPLSGLVYCDSCGTAMSLCTGGKDGRRLYLRCSTHASERSRCSRHSTDAEALLAAVSDALKAYGYGYASPSVSEEARSLHALRSALLRAGVSGAALTELDTRIAAAERPHPAQVPAFSRALALQLIARIEVFERENNTQRLRITYKF